MNLSRPEPKDVAEFLMRDARCRATGAYMQPAIVVTPGDRAMRFQMDMLNSRGGIGLFVDRFGSGEALFDAADLAVNIDVDIALRCPPFVVEEWSVRLHGQDRIEHCRQGFITDLDQAAGIVCG